MAEFDPAVCRSCVEREILALVDYRLDGEVTGPFRRTFDTPTGPVTVPQVYDAPVAFTFQGERFIGTAAFAVEDGTLRWFTACR